MNLTCCQLKMFLTELFFFFCNVFIESIKNGRLPPLLCQRLITLIPQEEIWVWRTLEKISMPLWIVQVKCPVELEKELE